MTCRQRWWRGLRNWSPIKALFKLAHTELEFAHLVEAGFSYEMADHAMNAIDNHVRGFTLQELSFPIKPKDYAKAAKEACPS